jgi:hypothetical protein
MIDLLTRTLFRTMISPLVLAAHLIGPDVAPIARPQEGTMP